MLKPKWRNGRRAGLKIRSWQQGVGSSPTFGTHDLRRFRAVFSRDFGNSIDLAKISRCLPGVPLIAAIRQRVRYFRILFRYHGKQHSFTIGPVNQREDEVIAARTNHYLLTRLCQSTPDFSLEWRHFWNGVTIVTFIAVERRSFRFR